MLDDIERHKVKAMVSDKVLVGAVKKVMRETFLKKQKVQDVHILASQTMANNLLDDAFDTLERYGVQTEKEIKDKEQVGL